MGMYRLASEGSLFCLFVVVHSSTWRWSNIGAFIRHTTAIYSSAQKYNMIQWFTVHKCIFSFNMCNVIHEWPVAYGWWNVMIFSGVILERSTYLHLMAIFSFPTLFFPQGRDSLGIHDRFCGRDVLPVTQPTVAWLYPVVAHHQTPDGRGIAAFMSVLWCQRQVVLEHNVARYIDNKRWN